jgi:hypothetical protein
VAFVLADTTAAHPPKVITTNEEIFMSKETWIYLIYDNTTKSYKIGNALNPLARLKQLQSIPTKMPFKIDLRLIEAWRGNEEDERELHRRFKSKRINGEWFNLDEEDLNALRAYFQIYTRLSTRTPEVHIRTCSYCNRRGDYDSFPDGSTVWLGIFACADCLQKNVTAEFREELAHYV